MALRAPTCPHYAHHAHHVGVGTKFQKLRAPAGCGEGPCAPCRLPLSAYSVEPHPTLSCSATRCSSSDLCTPCTLCSSSDLCTPSAPLISGSCEPPSCPNFHCRPALHSLSARSCYCSCSSSFSETSASSSTGAFLQVRLEPRGSCGHVCTSCSEG